MKANTKRIEPEWNSQSQPPHKHKKKEFIPGIDKDLPSKKGQQQKIHVPAEKIHATKQRNISNFFI